MESLAATSVLARNNLCPVALNDGHGSETIHNWTQQLLKYGLQDALNDITYDLAALALGAKMTAAWITSHLSETVDLTFGNTVSDSARPIAKLPGLRELKGDMQVTKLVTGDFASSLWLKVFDVLLGGFCSHLAYSAHTSADDRLSELP
ncbi:hypothetical protein AYL99_09423 [Fonsecaea erecta]|uniref:Uncharacterized protein n=1 Tax=Fonsecaea erecta TaxID=1367422 RepID=A0A178Z8Y1_9EURO|nr:hypothetical protein AYL99_09423 [Fonsecaea erecta]OAP56244.1 hypothetical protein AYL99_09423 [Fonsecaea erecta]